MLLSGIFINGYPIIDIAYRHQLYLFPLPVAQFEFVIEESTTRKIQAMFCDDYKHAQCHGTLVSNFKSLLKLELLQDSINKPVGDENDKP